MQKCYSLFTKEKVRYSMLHCVIKFCIFHDVLSDSFDNLYQQEQSTLFVHHTAHSYSLSRTLTKSHEVLMGNLDTVSILVLHHNYLRSSTWNNSSIL